MRNFSLISRTCEICAYLDVFIHAYVAFFLITDAGLQFCPSIKKSISSKLKNTLIFQAFVDNDSVVESIREAKVWYL